VNLTARRASRRTLPLLVVALSLAAPPARAAGPATPPPVQLLNVSYDPTRELYEAVNVAFAARWKEQTGQDVSVRQSHGGSGKQARSVIDGLEADVVTLALPQDLDAISRVGLIKPGWRARLPDGASPYTSTIVFLVRKGNPKGIHDWTDLVKPGVELVTPNPKTGGGSRLVYLAAWGAELARTGGDQAKARELARALYRNVIVLDTGARGSATTFLERRLGDVLLTWENEALLAAKRLGSDVEIVAPPVSILAEPPVAVVDAAVDSHGTRAVAEAYLRFLWTDEGQAIAAAHFYRPRRSTRAGAGQAPTFLPVKTFTVEERFGSWDEAQRLHFADGGTFDQIYEKQ
jgi:sulfate transport system substrate-binding protein